MNINLDKLVYNLKRVLREEKETELLNIVTKAVVTSDSVGYDNWDGGLDLLELQVSVDISMYVRIKNDVSAIENRLFQKLSSLSFILKEAAITNIRILPILENEDFDKEQLRAKTIAIKEYLDTEYVNKKVDKMNNAIQNDTDLAIGTGKELLETICKAILKQKTVEINEEWTLPQLLKYTTNSLDFKPKEADDPQGAERSIKQILGGIQTIVHGISELRNAYGTGHGKDANFKGLESKYAKLFVGIVAEIAIIYLVTNGETEMVGQ